ncbi:SpoIIIAC/SpoIIIAD family protein, partial [Paenibacillus xylanexedens]
MGEFGGEMVRDGGEERIGWKIEVGGKVLMVVVGIGMMRIIMERVMKV